MPIHFGNLFYAQRDAEKEANSEICRERGYHDEEEFIDPQSGGFTRCKTCGYEVDREESEEW